MHSKLQLELVDNSNDRQCVLGLLIYSNRPVGRYTNKNKKAPREQELHEA